MIIDISKIILSDNTTKSFNCSLDASTITYNHATYSIIECKPFTLDITCTDSNKINITAEICLKVRIPCDRCLSDVEYDFNVLIDKSLEISDDKTLSCAEDEMGFAKNTELDVDKLIFDYVLVDWPTKVLCQEDCKGLCQICGINLNKETCNCKAKIVDPRMAKFQDIFDSFKEV